MKLLYLNTENLYPHDLHLISGLKESGQDVIKINIDKNKSYLQIAKTIYKQSRRTDAIIIGFTSPILAIIARISTTKKIIFNAVSSQFEANIISRSINNKKTITSIKWWVIDYLSFHFSTKVLLESRAQIDFIRKLFWVSKKKLVLSYSGVNEKDFYFIPNINKKIRFTVLFRGRFLPESGILTVIESAKKLENENIDFLIIGHGFLYREVNALMDQLKPRNIKMITDKVNIEDLRKMMLECHISLGQLADHPRLDRTLPCKLFESLALRLPYLTGRNRGVLEILKDGETCIAINPGDSDDLSRKILELKNNPKKLEMIAEGGYKLYREKLTSKILAKNIFETCIR